MLTHLAFTLDGHRYYAVVDQASTPWMWRVSVDGGPRYSVFPASQNDQDTEEFRRLLIRAAASAPKESAEVRDRRKKRRGRS